MPFSFICLPSTSGSLRIVMKMTSKRIETGTPEGDAMGFSENLFTGWLEMQDGNRLYLHFIISRRRNEGNTQALLRQWLSGWLRCPCGHATAHNAAHPRKNIISYRPGNIFPTITRMKLKSGYGQEPCNPVVFWARRQKILIPDVLAHRLPAKQCP